MTLDELYQQYDNVSVERISQVQPIQVVLYPNRNKEIAGEVLLPKNIQSNKIELSLEDAQENVYWKRNDAFFVSKDSPADRVPFQYVVKDSLPEGKQLTLKVKLFQDVSLVGQGSVKYENKSLQQVVLPTLSDIKTVLSAEAVKVSTVVDFAGEQDLGKRALVVQVFDSNGQKLSQYVSAPQRVKANSQSVFYVEFAKPKKAGNYKIDTFLQDASQKASSSHLGGIFTVEGDFAKLRTVVFSRPESEIFEKEETVKITGTGFVNKRFSSLNIVMNVTNEAKKTLYTEDFEVPVNRLKEFSFEKQFSLPFEAKQIKATMKIYHQGKPISTEDFASERYEKRVVAKEKKNEKVALTEKKSPQPIPLLFILGGMFMLLILIGFIYWWAKRPKKNKTLSMFLLLLGVCGVMPSVSAGNIITDCSPKTAISNGQNLHCKVFTDEVYNGNADAGYFAKIPFVSTAIDSGTGQGKLTPNKEYQIDVAVCNNADCSDVIAKPNVAEFTAPSADWFRAELDASKLGVEANNSKILKIKAVILKRTGATTHMLVYQNPYEIIVDRKKPMVTFERKSSTNIPLAENPISGDYYNTNVIAKNFTKEPITVTVQCNDGNSSAGCMESSYEVLVKGNFCDDNDICKKTAVRTYKICDKVRNCTEQELVIKNYDTAAPSFSGSSAKLADEGGSEAQTETFGGVGMAPAIKTFENFLFSLASVTDVSSAKTGFDADACGHKDSDESKDNIVKDNTRCVETKKVCSDGSYYRAENKWYQKGTTSCTFSCPGDDGSETNPEGLVQVDCETVRENSEGKCCLPYKLICGYRFGFCFPLRF
ncbi:hypothetical protein CSB37_01345 [bacterium DOLZORAL124_38_8]|nr:MAG: hypothetical protein CSB37_01345 [bacterium DOLZORAL124_38_8]